MLLKVACAAAFVFAVAFIAVMNANQESIYAGQVSTSLTVVVSVLGWSAFLSALFAIAVAIVSPVEKD